MYLFPKGYVVSINVNNSQQSDSECSFRYVTLVGMDSGNFLVGAIDLSGDKGLLKVPFSAVKTIHYYGILDNAGSISKVCHSFAKEFLYEYIRRYKNTVYCTVQSAILGFTDVTVRSLNTGKVQCVKRINMLVHSHKLLEIIENHNLSSISFIVKPKLKVYRISFLFQGNKVWSIN